MRIRSLCFEAGRFFGAVRRHRSNPVLAALRYWRLYRYRRFSPDEILFYRVLDSTISEADLLEVVSKEELLVVQRRLNPAHLHIRTEDKLFFHEYCLKADLPVPEIFALYDPDRTASDGVFPALFTADAVARFLREVPADTLILKPVSGVSGKGVMRLERRGNEWRDSGGDTCSAESLVALMQSTPFRRWIFQKVIEGHPSLSALSGTRGLQTVRVVTVVEEDGQVRILAARLRLICGDLAHDNFAFGKTGNLIAILDPVDGQVRTVVGGEREYCQIRSVTHHPDTGRDLIGFEVPEWERVRELTIDAANAFKPLRTIGWDVAIAPDGPCLIEGNVTWDTLSGEPQMGRIYRYLKALQVDHRKV